MTLAMPDLLRDATLAARVASLRYVSAEEPGIERRGEKGRFFYVMNDGKRVRQRDVLERIANLGIPPAWTRVWICTSADGHLQCTGYDVRGRKQYRYHAKWREVRDGAKYEDALEFGAALPKLRAAITRDLGNDALTKDTVIAAALRVMDLTHIRVGNDRYVEQNKSYGLTTLLARHTKVHGGTIELDFRGKGGKTRHAEVQDARLAKILKRCLDIPGQRLFRWCDGAGGTHPITSSDVNEYIFRVTGKPFTAKEFRTWTATVGAARLLYECDPCASATHGKRTITEAIKRVSEELGNTPAICKKSYVHPAILDAYLQGSLHPHMSRGMKHAARAKGIGIRRAELAVLHMLQLHKKEAPRALEKALARSLQRGRAA